MAVIYDIIIYVKATDRNKICKNCGVLFYNPYGLSLCVWKKRMFCSKSCSAKVVHVGQKAWNKGIKKIHNSPETEFKKGDPRVSGKNNHRWNGGREKSGNYIQILKRGHPTADKRGRIMEHRFLIEKFIGRLLKKSEIVHHKNGNKLDNRIENLEIMTRSEHMRHHLFDIQTKRKNSSYLKTKPSK